MKNLIYIILLLATIACQPQKGDAPVATIENQETKMTKPALIHTVYFWTKEGTTEEQTKAFEKGLEKLGTCPQIHSFFWGPPAPTEARGVVDNTFSYAISVQFASIEKQNEYQKEPIHLEFIENHQDIWEKVIVYDNTVK